MIMRTGTPSPLPWKTRLQVVGASALCFAAACATPALELTGQEHQTIFGAEALFYGLLAMLIGQFAGLANPLWLTALLLMSRGRPRSAAMLSLAAFLVGNHVWALFGQEIPGDEGNVTKLYLQSLDIGFYLWLLSFLILAVGSGLSWRNMDRLEAPLF
jgi:hypothetical protein